MASAGKLEIDMPELVSELVLKVTVKRGRQAIFRVRLARPILWLANKIGGFGGYEFKKVNK